MQLPASHHTKAHHLHSRSPPHPCPSPHSMPRPAATADLHALRSPSAAEVSDAGLAASATIRTALKATHVAPVNPEAPRSSPSADPAASNASTGPQHGEPSPSPSHHPIHRSQGGLWPLRMASIARRGSCQNADDSNRTLRPVSRHRLDRMDLAEYAGHSLFHQVARQVCLLDGVIPRKELHEAWEAAVRIQAMFPHQLRVADLASGNGLLGWILLLMDASGRRSVICIDMTKPCSAVQLSSAFLAEWPHLQARQRYVEADLSHLQPQPDALLVSMHGCGGLTDKVIEMAMAARAALAVVPCCHSLAGSCGTGTVRAHPRGEGAEAHVRRGAARFGVGLALDAARVAVLRHAGYRVCIDHLPEDITPKNRMLLAFYGSCEPSFQNHHAPDGSPPGELGELWPSPRLPDSPWTKFKMPGPAS